MRTEPKGTSSARSQDVTKTIPTCTHLYAKLLMLPIVLLQAEENESKERKNSQILRVLFIYRK